MMRLFLFTFLFLCLSSPSPAQETEDDPRIIKDSVYFTMDDGLMTPEEMKEEARYVHAQCMDHLYQSTYFDCACIAGAFLNEREKRGPMVMQDVILDDLYRAENESAARCGNQAVIAGTIYNDCMEVVGLFRRRETNNEQFCQCTGNRVARDFAEYPYLRTAYIRQLRVNAMLTCSQQYPSIRRTF